MTINEFLYKEESFAVIGAAMEVHRTLGWGFLENVYQTALAHEFALRDIPFAQQVRLPIYYKDVFAGEYIADFVVCEKLIVEIKSILGMTPGHQAQALNYLAATGYSPCFVTQFWNSFTTISSRYQIMIQNERALAA